MAAGKVRTPLQAPNNRKVSPQVTENLTARVTEAIRRSIVDAEYQLGEALSEIRLAEKYKVSRTPVREALNELQRQGLIVIRPQSGSFVFMPSEEDVAELCEFRRMLEVAAIRLAHARRPAETIAQLHAAIGEMVGALETEDQLAYAHADSAFHQAGVDNSANMYLIEAYKLVSGRLETLRSHNLTNWQKLRNKITAEHRAIASAFEKGDLMQVEEIIDEHVSRLILTFRIARRTEKFNKNKLNKPGEKTK
jgi:DNA-binding GntR family transcriptional regulator